MYDKELILATVAKTTKKFGIPPTFEILARRVHLSVNTLRKIGSLQDILLKAGFDLTSMPKQFSQFEKSVYYSLCEVFGKDDVELQKKFNSCSNKQLLRFDFYIKSINLAIEVDGAFHYNEKSSWSSYHKITDPIKNNFCILNSINLLRVRHQRYRWNGRTFNKALKTIQLHCLETSNENFFNCWDGSEFTPIPISSQDCNQKCEKIITVKDVKSYVEYKVSYKGQTNTILLDKSFYNKMNYSLYLKCGKVYTTDTGKLLANRVLGVEGTSKYVVIYKNGNKLDVRKSNLELKSASITHGKRGVYRTSKTGDTRITKTNTKIHGKPATYFIAKNSDGKKKYFNLSKYNTEKEALDAAKAWLQ